MSASPRYANRATSQGFISLRWSSSKDFPETSALAFQVQPPCSNAQSIKGVHGADVRSEHSPVILQRQPSAACAGFGGSSKWRTCTPCRRCDERRTTLSGGRQHAWQREVVSVQPRIRLLRSFGERSPNYLGMRRTTRRSTATAISLPFDCHGSGPSDCRHCHSPFRGWHGSEGGSRGWRAA